MLPFDTILKTVGFILIFGILVFIHELGHFLVARRNGIVTEEFGFGFPPRAFTLHRGKARLIIGGRKIIAPAGLALPEGLTVGSRVHYQANEDKRGRNWLQTIALIPEDDPRYAQAQEVMLVDPGTIYSINWLPLGGFVRMRGEDGLAGPGSFVNASKRGRAATLLAGPGMNLVMAGLVFAVAAMLGLPIMIPGGEISEVRPASPAAQADLRVGDRVFAINDTEVLYAGDIADYVAAHPGSMVTLHLERAGQPFEVTLAPRVSPPAGEGAIGIGITPMTELVRSNPLQALVIGLRDTVDYIRLTVSVPSLLIRGAITPADARPVGPVGIFALTGSAIEATQNSGYWYPILRLMGILSAALAITNLLPLPALDGGRLLFIVIEKLRGRRVDPNWEGAIHFAGMVALLALMAFITYKDLNTDFSFLSW